MIKKLCFIKPDLDTVATAAILLDKLPQEVCALTDNASADLLNDPEVLCIECGGSGDTDHSNFDHHINDIDLPCAAEQAWKHTGADSDYEDFIRFVAEVDLGLLNPQKNSDADPDSVPFSFVFSGMLLIEKDPYTRMRHGFKLVKKALNTLPSFDPYKINRFDSRFQKYIKAKINAQKILFNESRSIKYFSINSFVCMYLSTVVPGVHGLLRTMGADLSIAHNPESNFYSVSVRSGLEYLMPAVMNRLNASDPGWGGHPERGIIGSPRKGTVLNRDSIINHIQEVLVRCAS